MNDFFRYSIIVYYLTTLEKSIFTISKLLILQNLTRFEKPTRKLQRYFMGFVFVLSLFLTSTYSSGLSSIMTIPRYDNPINTVADFVKSDIYWGATSDAWKTSMETAQEEQVINVQNLLFRIIYTNISSHNLLLF